MSPTETAEQIEMPTGRRNPVLSVGLDPPGKGAILGDISPPSVKYMEYPACGQYSQPYSIGGSSDVTLYSQYCSNLFVLLFNKWRTAVIKLASLKSTTTTYNCLFFFWFDIAAKKFTKKWSH